MTDGILFRETLMDPLLSRYSAIMVRAPCSCSYSFSVAFKIDKSSRTQHLHRSITWRVEEV